MTTDRFPVTADGGRTTVRLSGEVDVFRTGALRQALEQARLLGVGDVDVDAADVQFIDTAGLRVLVDADRRLRADGRRLRVVRPSPAVARLLAVARAGWITTAV